MKISFILLILSFNVFSQIPISGPKSLEYNRVKYELWLRLVDEYEKSSKENEEIKKKIISLIKGFAQIKCKLPGFSSEKQLGKEALTISLEDVSSPIAKCILGEVLLEGAEKTAVNFHKSFRLIQEGCKGVDSSIKSPFVKLFCSKWLRESLLYTNKLDARAFQEIMESYSASLLDYLRHETEEKEQRFLAELMMVFMGDIKEFSAVEKFFNLFKNDIGMCKPWLREMTFGAYYAAKSWKVRGLGYANSVSKNNMETFRKYSKIAGEHFKKAFDLKPERPEAAARLISISMEGGTNETTRFWFNKAVEAEIDNEAAYSSLLWAYRPRWGGSHQQMLSFGQECANTKLYDTLIPSFYIKAVDAIKEETNFETIDRMGLYEQMHKVFKTYGEIEAQNKLFLHSAKNYYRAWHFCYAVKLNKFIHTKKLYELYGDDIYIKRTFESFGIKLKHEVARAYAMSGKASGLISKIHKALSWTNVTQSNIVWPTKLQLNNFKRDIADIANMTPEKEALPYLNYIKKMVDIHTKYYDGDWVDLTFSKDLAHWKIFGGNWEVIDKKTILASTMHNEKQYLSSQALLKPPFVVELEVEGLKSTSRGGTLQAGLIIGRMYNSTGRAFWADSIRKKAGWAQPEKNPNWLKLSGNGKKTVLSVYVWDGYFEYYINKGQEVLREKQKGFKSLRVGIGIMPWWKITGDVRYSNFRIKKLNLQKPPPQSSIKDQIEHYSQLINEDNKIYLSGSLGRIYYRIKQYAKAIEYYKRCDAEMPDWWNAMKIASSYNRLKEYKESKEFYELAFKRSRDNDYGKQLVNNSYAFFLSTCPEAAVRNPQRAVLLSLEALNEKVDPYNKPAFMDTLACSYAASGDFKKALEVLENMLKLKLNEGQKKDLLLKKELFSKKKIYINSPD